MSQDSLSNNAIYLTLGGVNVAGLFVEFTLDTSAARIDVTHGAATWVQSNPGLFDGTFTCILTYSVGSVSTYISKMARGQIYVIDFGPEGNASGKPRHTQSVMVEKATGPKVTAKKDHVTFSLSFVPNDIPTNDLYAGATF